MLFLDAGIRDWNRREQRFGIGVIGRVKDLIGRAQFHHMAEIHHHHTIRQVPHDREVVADEEQRGFVFPLDVHQEVCHSRLNRHIKRRDRFVRHNDPCATGEGTRDTDTLLLTTRELARHPICKGAGQLH